MEAESYRASTGLVGFFIIGTSLGFGAAFCIGICLISWLRKRRREKNKNLPPLSIKCIQKQHKVKPAAFPPHQPPGILFFPSISNSEPGSETCSQKSIISATSPLTTEAAMSFKTFVDHHRRAQEARRENSDNSSFCRCKMPFSSPPSLDLGIDKKRRRNLSSPITALKYDRAKHPQTWTGPVGVYRFQEQVDMMVNPVSKSSSNLDIISKCDDNLRFLSDTSKYKIGQIRLRITHSKATGQMSVGLFHEVCLPTIMKIKYTEMYAKFSLFTKTIRLKKVIPLQTATNISPFGAVFSCDIASDTFTASTLNISLCKRGEHPSQRVVVGVASISLQEIDTSRDQEGNFEREINADLLEASIRHKVDCKGVLSFDLSFDTSSNSLLLLNVIFEEFEAKNIARENDSCQYSEIYLKAMAYKGSNALCWRRGSSVFIEASDSSVSLASLICLPTSMPDFKDVTLVLMIKQKFATRGRRNLLGKLLLNMDCILNDETIQKKAAAGIFWKKSIKLDLHD